MFYTLDTNFVSQIINENQACKARLNRAVQELHRITLSPIVFWEAKRGLLKPEYALKLARLEQFANTYPCLWFDKEAADTASSIHFELTSTGNDIGISDTLIAATAIRHKAVLITRNVKHFSRVIGIRFENWEDGVM